MLRAFIAGVESMAHHAIRAAAVVAATLALCGAAYAAPACRGSKIYTHCKDNYTEHVSSCSADSAFYQSCVGAASSGVVYTCQKYRVPCNFEGTDFVDSELARYPKVGPASLPQPGGAPPDHKSGFWASIFRTFDPARAARAPQQ